ncbi:TonB-dependent receptor domain-containing protein [Rufibacter glacialis]|uniref:TonB-dependent receptor n=1 Tax=Rufibacter glacialis TaxID=1259555 RepID=A0A5M8QEN6_9BACT|nr:TonB-dependent receptor [Rufibacter glacialis]KAA6433216.1 TonB-dependent receptor [Rufibacter glacialis]GGK76387.1 TonB-dependent receptor [Rufibacter glacialis]
MKYLFTFLLSLSFLPLFAQVTINGRVLDARTQQPLEGATVSEAVTRIQAVTDASGQFRLVLSSRADTLLVQRVTHRLQKLVVPQGRKPLVILLEPLAVDLQEVVVKGYETRRPLLQTAGSMAVLEKRDLERFSETTLVPALNTIPGVRMEERATGSYRLSIRGSSLRAPFGVRNVKVYLNEVPLVEANSTLPLNLLDAATIGSVEVIKGPAGSTYGAGTGGTVLLETVRPAPGETSVSVGGVVGSFGLRRAFVSAAVGSEKSNFLVRYDRQELEGYREQSALDRKTLLVSGQLNPSEKQTFSFHGYYSDLYYELPGALTRTQFAQNPRAARQLNKDQKASIDLNALNLGLAHTYRFNEAWSNTTSVFGVFSFFDNPFPTDYERNTNQALGGRTRTTYRTAIIGQPTRFTLGAEGYRSFMNSRHYQNVKGQTDTLRYDDEIVQQQGFVFGQTEVDLPANFILTLGASLNSVQYQLTRVFDAAISSSVPTQRRNLNPQFSPRVGLVKVITPHLSVHASWSTGFSPPTDAEIRPSTGSFNTTLQPEKGRNYEVGIRGNSANRRLTYDVVSFRFRLKETIVVRTNAQDQDEFLNAGATWQQGAEAAVGYDLVQAPAKNLRQVRLWSTYAFSYFRFQDYVSGDNDYSGNRLTGTPAHVLTLGLDASTKPGFYLHATANYTSDIPLNDANTVYAPEYYIFGGRTGFRRTLLGSWRLDLYAGVDNASDRDYSLGNDLNGFGGRYFQAAPGRNYYGGVQVKKSF